MIPPNEISYWFLSLGNTKSDRRIFTSDVCHVYVTTLCVVETKQNWSSDTELPLFIKSHRYCGTMASTEATADITVDRKLREIFDEAYKLFYSFDSCTEPTNSTEFQVSKLCARHMRMCIFADGLHNCCQFVMIKLYDMRITGENQEVHGPLRGCNTFG